MNLNEFINRQNQEMQRIRPFDEEINRRLTDKWNQSGMNVEDLAEKAGVQRQLVLDAIYGAEGTPKDIIDRVEHVWKECAHA